MLGSGTAPRESALALKFTQQARQNTRLLILVTATTVLSMVTNLGGFSRELLVSALAKHAAFAAFLAITYILILMPKQRELIGVIISLLIVAFARDCGLITSETIGLYVWLAGLAALLPLALRGQRYEIPRLYFIMVSSLLLPVASTLALVGQQLTVGQPNTFDMLAYLSDQAYGVSASAILGRVTLSHPVTHQLLSTVYRWLPIAVSICYVLNVRAGNRDAGVILKAALAAGAIAFVLYHLYPAAGPIYAFGPGFPAALPDPSSLAPTPTGLAVPGAPRNCMPSVHFVWAILAAVEARRLGRARRTVFYLFAVLTALATIALGEHYVIDLVAAVPFALCVHAVFARRRSWLIGWRGTAIYGGLATLCWLLFLRMWTPPPHVSLVLWTMTVVTLGGSVMLRLEPRTGRAAWSWVRGVSSRDSRAEPQPTRPG